METSQPVHIKLNGEPYELSAPITVQGLLDTLGLDGRRVAVERNLEVVKRGRFDEQLITDGDEVEIVNFVGGG
jgi:thiamine biosynthesis protein ThiS